jgi:hypothetical protein
MFRIMSSLQTQQNGDTKEKSSVANLLDAENLPDNLEEAHDWIRSLMLKISTCMGHITRLEESICRFEVRNLSNKDESLDSFD